MPRDGKSRGGRKGGDGRTRGRSGQEASPVPAARAIWSGSISFGLVTVPVELYAAHRRTGVSLRMLGPDGTPLARRYVCPQDGEVVEGDDIVRGYEVADGVFVTVTDDELDELAPRRSREIELARFVDRHAIDPAWFVRAYFLVPSGEQTKAYRLLAETMEKSGRAGLASFVMRGKAYVVAIFAERGILRAETMRFGDELRSIADLGLPEASEPKADRVKAMRTAIDDLTEEGLDPSELRDAATERLLALAKAKHAHGEGVVRASAATAEEEEAEGGAEIVDLMALLKQRLRAPGRGSAGARGAKSGDGLEDRSKAALYERAQQLKISGRSKMSRDELLRAIRNAG